MNSVQTIFFGIREYLSPVLKNSKFKETGCITPEEFEAAGDFLVYKCPTWSWEGGEASKRRDYLHPEKQFLITRNGRPSFIHGLEFDGVPSHMERLGLAGREQICLCTKAYQGKIM